MNNFKEGDYVHYIPEFGEKENGRVKSVRKDIMFVVYHCGNDWNDYHNYTAVSTRIIDLKHGWIDEKGNPYMISEREYCDHHYILTNNKWQSITQKQCCHCGDIID